MKLISSDDSYFIIEPLKQLPSLLATQPSKVHIHPKVKSRLKAIHK
jgi:hypothetical protein